MAGSTREYLIGPIQGGTATQTLERLKTLIEQDPEASIVKDGSAHVVANMSDEAAARLSAALGEHLIIEPNSELKY